LFPSDTWDKLEILQNKKKGIVYASPNWCLNKIVFKLEGFFLGPKYGTWRSNSQSLNNLEYHVVVSIKALTITLNLKPYMEALKEGGNASNAIETLSLV